MKRLLPCLKSWHSNLRNCKVLFKKTPKKQKKTIAIFAMHLRVYQKWFFLTIIVNFGIGSVFSKGPGSAFTEGLVTGPGLFYKIYLAHPVLELIVFFFIVNTYFSMKRMFLHWKCLYLETFHWRFTKWRGCNFNLAR